MNKTHVKTIKKLSSFFASSFNYISSLNWDGFFRNLFSLRVALFTLQQQQQQQTKKIKLDKNNLHNLCIE